MLPLASLGLPLSAMELTLFIHFAQTLLVARRQPPALRVGVARARLLSSVVVHAVYRVSAALALGTRLGPFGTLPQYDLTYWPEDAKIIQVDADSKMLGLVKKIDVGICGDAGAAAKALTARLSEGAPRYPPRPTTAWRPKLSRKFNEKSQTSARPCCL